MANHRRKDCTGERIGSLVAVRRYDVSNAGQHRWLFRCDCGGEMVGIPASVRCDFRQHGRRSCDACASNMTEDLTGRRFGRWLVLGIVRGAGRWLCRCDCGRERRMVASELTSRGPNDGDLASCRQCFIKRIMAPAGQAGGQLRQARRAAGISTRQLAAILGVSHQAVSHTEKADNLWDDTITRYRDAIASCGELQEA